MTKGKKSNPVQLDMGFMSGMDKDIDSSMHDQIMLWVEKNLISIMKEVIPDIEHIGKTKWEFPITTIGERGAKYIVGFIDLLAEVSSKTLGERCRMFGLQYIGFEIKTTISSLGQLIRQINAYKEYNEKKIVFVVVSPDDRHATTLESQDIYFVKYDPSRFQ